jgi:hypothetical protein
MAVIVKIVENGKFLFSSVKGLGISENDQKRAIQLNELIIQEMAKLVAKLKRLRIKVDIKTRNKIEAYWEFGSILRKIFFESGLVDPTERKLVWLNVRMHAPSGLLAKDRGPNRIHIDYCFRLANYPKSLALKREWSEWLYLFDSPFINNEERFDEWDKTKIEADAAYVNRENTRLFIKCLNAILKDIETKDLNDEELFRCYEGAWKISKKLINDFGSTDSNEFKLKIKSTLSGKSNYVGQLIEGIMNPEEFANKMTSINMIE